MKPVLSILLASLLHRETLQEFSHDRYILTVKEMLDLNNTISVADPTFGLLVNTQAAPGMGTVVDVNCLQLTIADCAFTNAKASNNLAGMVASLIYRALERNTAGVGLASEQCTSYTPQNKELAAFHQHQDPASPGAQANNKATALELARQIALIGGELTGALYSGTFQRGEVGSTDVSGNACDAADCIFTENLLVRDASEAEIYDYAGNCVETVTFTIGAGKSAYVVYQRVSLLSSRIKSSIPTGTSTIARTTSTTATTIPDGTIVQQTSTTTMNQPSTPAAPTTTVTPAPTAAGTTIYITFTGAYLSVTAP